MEFAEYAGFTEADVQRLCTEYYRDFSLMKQWYDGYTLDRAGSVYNPNSVMKAIRSNKYYSYWTETSASKSLMGYISLDFDGLSLTLAKLLGGIDLEFAKAIREVKRDDTIRRIRESEQLIYDTVHKNAEAVALQIQKIHAEETAILYYNDEQALRSVIKLAYFSYKDHYLKFEELPAGDGYADIVYFPKKTSPMPALVIELKWDQSARGAIDQIKEKRYPAALAGYGGSILLVGICYEKESRKDKHKHTCVIEEVG